MFVPKREYWQIGKFTTRLDDSLRDSFSQENSPPFSNPFYPHPFFFLFLKASSDNNTDRRRQSLISDIVQAQLALWTLVITVFYSYAWQQHRKKFLVSLVSCCWLSLLHLLIFSIIQFVVVPPVLVICCTLSSLLTAIVILGRLFSSPLRFQDILRMNGEIEESEGQSAEKWRK
jgi:hypothetical protein